MEILFIEGWVFDGEGFRWRQRREAETVGVEACHELPRVNDLWFGPERLGFGEWAREDGTEGEARRWGGRRWVEGEEAVGGGGEGHDVVSES